MRGLCKGSCRCIVTRGDRATEKVSICTCLLCAFPALRFVKCSLTVRQVQFRSPLAKIITTSRRKCARSCGVGDVVQGGGRCLKQYLSVLRGCISGHCANIHPHNLAFSVARSPTRAHSLHFGHCSLMSGSLPSRALVQMFSTGDTLPPTTSKFASRLTDVLTTVIDIFCRLQYRQKTCLQKFVSGFAAFI